MDVKSTFLHGDIFEEIYMEQPLVLWYILILLSTKKVVVWFEISPPGLVC